MDWHYLSPTGARSIVPLHLYSELLLSGPQPVDVVLKCEDKGLGVNYTRAEVRGLVRWSGHYRAAWDDRPEQYVENGLLSWGRSRRIGVLRLGEKKAYLGVQHIDPAQPGWEKYAAPESRFFVSLFVGGNCVALRNTTTLGDALDLLGDFLEG